MKILLDKNEIISAIREYSNHKYMWVEIWEMSEHEIQGVITVNSEEECHLGQFKVLNFCSAQTDSLEDIAELKKYSKSMVRILRINFPDSKVKSRLYYK